MRAISFTISFCYKAYILWISLAFYDLESLFISLSSFFVWKDSFLIFMAFYITFCCFIYFLTLFFGVFSFSDLAYFDFSGISFISSQSWW